MCQRTERFPNRQVLAPAMIPPVRSAPKGISGKKVVYILVIQSLVFVELRFPRVFDEEILGIIDFLHFPQIVTLKKLCHVHCHIVRHVLIYVGGNVHSWPIEQNLARHDLPTYTLSSGDDGTKSEKLLQKWLDGFASLLAGSSAGSRKNQVCALSLSLSQSSCDLTIAFNWTLPHTEDDARKLIYTIWDWLKDASALPEEDVEKNEELLATIPEVSRDTGYDQALTLQDTNLAEPQRNFLHKAGLLHSNLYEMLGPTVRKPDFRMASAAFQYRVKEYKYALSQLDDLYSLPPFKRF
ncbi:hypothetical protein GGX14DRAFT_634190 [Mycena pura]|uniref:Uncharacterized protein n=1 Tax=Mycena pura TaxID=153505 RepID=A0AAD6Y8V1_9AGAR|nr:hypothetical protein GGX14DRAFT_634190 [Mycena pura]